MFAHGDQCTMRFAADLVNSRRAAESLWLPSLMFPQDCRRSRPGRGRGMGQRRPVGRRLRGAVTRLMTCLTLTPTTVDEAIGERAEMVVVHHPLPFRPVVRITTDSTSGRLLWRLIGAGISVYSAHTAFDSAAEGINQQWADALGLSAIEPLIPSAKTNTGGAAPPARAAMARFSGSSNSSKSRTASGRFCPSAACASSAVTSSQCGKSLLLAAAAARSLRRLAPKTATALSAERRASMAALKRRPMASALSCAATSPANASPWNGWPCNLHSRFRTSTPGPAGGNEIRCTPYDKTPLPRPHRQFVRPVDRPRPASKMKRLTGTHLFVWRNVSLWKHRFASSRLCRCITK